jgi:hypothetical protein
MENESAIVRERMEFLYFPTPINIISMPEYIDIVREVGEEAMTMLPEEIQPTELYPSKQSVSFQGHPKIQEFGKETIQIAWDILNMQGYDMQKFNTFYESMWLQEHHKMSAMDQHIHDGGIQLVGFYFLDTPPESSKLVFYDPRPGKIQINLPETNVKNITSATKMVNFEPKAGDLIFAPSWLPHSFSRHGSDETLRFVHINVVAQAVPQFCHKEEVPEDGPVII